MKFSFHSSNKIGCATQRVCDPRSSPGKAPLQLPKAPRTRGPRCSRPLPVPAPAGLPRGRDTGHEVAPAPRARPGAGRAAGAAEPRAGAGQGSGAAPKRPQSAPQPAGRAQAPSPAPCRPLTGRARRRPGN